jgi:hypothetical protein
MDLKVKFHMKHTGAVYLLQVGQLYKIGCSKNPEKRIRQLQTGSSASIRCIHLLPTDYYRQIERQLHLKFAAQRGLGEWFALRGEDVAYIQSLNENGLTQAEELRRNRERKAEQAAHEQAMAARNRDEARRAMSVVAAV